MSIAGKALNLPVNPRPYAANRVLFRRLAMSGKAFNQCGVQTV
jgi:hypothetical protein